MNTLSLTSFSDALADIAATIAPSVVQVRGRRRPASGIVFDSGTVLTTARALGREDGLRVQTPDGRTIDADLAGWDPATSLAVLRVPGLDLSPPRHAEEPTRVGQLAMAVARSWSNALTASAGIVSIIGGPLRTGRGRSIDQVIRTTAPMHDGFAGGAFIGPSGGLVGVTTATSIRGLGVVIPVTIAWKAAAEVVRHGTLKRGFLGVAGQPVHLSTRQRSAASQDRGVLVMGLTPNSPSDDAGLLVGDILLELDGHPVQSPEDLLELLVGDRVGRSVPLRFLRGGDSQTVSVTVRERSPA